MIYRPLSLAALLASALIAFAGAPAAAQPAAAAGPTASASAPGWQGQRAHPRMNAERWQQARAERAAALKSKLALDAGQEGAWNALQQALQPSAHARIDQRNMAGLSTPERIDRMRALRAQRAAQADQRGEAIKRFYSQLTPQQQKVFDAQGPAAGNHMLSGGGRGHGGKHRNMRRHGGPAA